MNESVSRRALLGALGASALLPALAGAGTFPAHSIPASSRELWTWVRAQLVIDPELAGFDTAAAGPVLRAVMVGEYRSRERQSEDFHHYQVDVLGPGTLHEPLAAVAAFLGAEADEIAFTTGCTEALATVARALELQPGDQILAGPAERGGRGEGGVGDELLQFPRRNTDALLEVDRREAWKFRLRESKQLEAGTPAFQGNALVA